MENVITLIGMLLLFCPPTSLFCFFEISKNTRNELARPVMGTIFLVIKIWIRKKLSPRCISAKYIDMCIHQDRH